MGEDGFDLAAFGGRLGDDTLRAMREAKPGGSLPRPGSGEPYLGGPIPMGWIHAAVALPGQAWHVACALWFEASCSKGKAATVQLSRRTRRFFRLDRQAIYRALLALEKAKLIRLTRRRGKVSL